MKRLASNLIYFDYDVNVSDVPKHVANYMLGVLLSENLSWSNGTITFDELTRDEIESIRYHVRMNHFSNPYGFASKNGMKVLANKIVDGSPPKGSGPVLCCNGMGKDGMLSTLMTDEIRKGALPFTIGNQYGIESLWNERKNAMSLFYAQNGIIPARYIMTNYMKVCGYKIIPWWVMGLPLAYVFGSNVITTGCEISFSKNFVGTKRLLRPNISLFSCDSITRASGITVSSLTHALSAAGAQAVLTKRYPNSIQYQRSCMRGMPWCNDCGECYKTSMYLTSVGFDPARVGLNRDKWAMNEVRVKKANPITLDILYLMFRKFKKYPYDNWFEKACEPVFDFIWEGDKVKKIVSEHVDMYKKDPGLDRIGCEYRPSKWGKWLKDGIV